jgi:hypothetical protein
VGEISQQWTESFIMYIYNRVIKMTSNYQGISLLSVTYKSVAKILPLMLNSYIGEISAYNWCGFKYESPTGQTFCICHIHSFISNLSVYHQFCSYTGEKIGTQLCCISVIYKL